jgi:L-asparaginase
VNKQIRPRVLFVATGGTIASLPLTGATGAVPSLSAEDLVASVPGLDDCAEIVSTQQTQKPSVELDFADLAAVIATCREAVDGGAVGAVIAQGTDTIEETSYLLDLLWDRPEPLVLTGAMRNPSLAGSDGPANLLAATRVAVDASSRDRGVLVVFNEEIHTARDVVKTHTSSISAFRSWRTGPIGVIHEGGPRFHQQAPRHPVLASPVAALPPVALVRAAMKAS